MTTVQELSVLHPQYAETSHRFRAGWTFHQFLQSLGKTLLQHVEDPHSTEFQNLYTGLKEISQNLNASESERIRHRLEAIDRRLSELIAALEDRFDVSIPLNDIETIRTIAEIGEYLRGLTARQAGC